MNIERPPRSDVASAAPGGTDRSVGEAVLSHGASVAAAFLGWDAHDDDP
jgi:hypothetical protein